MSSSLLYVLTSNCSRDFLSTWGERLTVNFSMRVGKGMGPRMRAPVRRAVSAMSPVAWSRTRWSKALRRMRIFCVSITYYRLQRASPKGGKPNTAIPEPCGPGNGLELELWASRPNLPTRAAAGPILLRDLGDNPCADGPAAFADREAQALVHRDRSDELDAKLNVVAGHDHLGAFRKDHFARHVGRAEVELRTVVGEERRVTAAFVLREDIDLGLEVGVRLDRARLAENLPALDFLTADAADEGTDVVARLALIEQLAEHLDAGDDGLAGVLDADDLDFLADLDDAGLDTAGDDGAAAGDREHVLDRHQEGLVERTLGLRDPLVDGGHQLEDRVMADLGGLALERGDGGAGDDRNVVAVEVVLRKQLADFQLDELEDLGVVDQV